MTAFPVIMVSLYICIFVVGVSLLAKIIPSYRRVEILWLILFVSSVCVISFCSLNVYVVESLDLKSAFSRWRFIGHGVIAPSWFFFFMLSFSKARIFRSKLLVLPLSLIMLTTVTMAVIPSMSDLLINNFGPFQVHGARVVSFSNGPWFPIHIVTAYLCAFATIGYALVAIPFSKDSKRWQLIALSVGVIVGLTVDVYCVYTNSPLRWAMLSGGSYLITEGSILYAINRHSLFNLSSVAKNQVFQGISEPVLIIDQNFCLLDSNDSAKAVFGLKQKDCHNPINMFEAFKTLNFTVKEQDWSFLYKNGEERFFRIVAENLKSHSGKILFFHEITLHKKKEQDLNNHLAFKAKLLGMIAHDFSGVLSAQSQLSSSLERKVSPELRDNAISLSSSAQAGKDLLQNILIWARAQENSFKPLKKPYEMNALIKEVVNNLESVWSLKGLQIEIASEAAPVLLSGDTIMIESVVRNILTNAIRASSPNGEIEISLTVSQERARLCVKDNGSGMSPSTLLEVQNSGSAFGMESKSSEGFGIGLIIARRFAQIHDGLLTFDSKEGDGTLVTLWLPL